jgi:endonuclease/exonuclease/phosphatase family metal-dependent hydrolase
MCVRSLLLAPSLLLALLTSVVASGCSEAIAHVGPIPPAPPGDETSGSIELLTYNIAGLPWGLSGSSPARNTPQISERLAAWDLVLVQEDFGYHDALVAGSTLPHRSAPAQPGPLDLGDGLNRLSRTPFVSHAREPWAECNGVVLALNDCLTPKGFSVARHTLAQGVEVDVYNVHFDAGRSESDRATRKAQAEQLAQHMASRTSVGPVIVAGDTNMHVDELDDLKRWLSSTYLRDACEELECDEPARIDRVFVRGGRGLRLWVDSWSVAETFVDKVGDPLSDHEAVAVRIGWQREVPRPLGG